MRFTHAWANVAQINSFLKTLCFALTCCVMASVFTTLNLAISPPLIIERSCLSEVISTAESEPTEDEIKVFLSEAISARFDSKEGNLHLLSETEIKRRNLEQTALNKQNIKQKVFLEKENITIEGDLAMINADRLISVKEIRSALIYRLQIQFAKTSRSKLNPYGLVILNVIEIEEKVEGK